MPLKISSSLRRIALRMASLLVALLAGVFLSGMAQAQSGSVTTPVQRAVAGQTVILERFTPPPVTGAVDLAVVDQRAQIDMVAASKIRVRLQSLTVNGLRSISADSLQPLWQDLIGTEVTLADIYRIADAVDAAYLAAGYFSKTVVPVQEFSTGRIRLQVYEGYVQRVEINSDIPGIEGRLAPYIDRILAMRPIRVKEAERILLLMSDIGGLQIDGTFVRPDTPKGGGLLRLNIGQDRRSGMVGLDNLGSESVGPLELALSYQMNDLFRRFETTDLVGVTVPDDPEEMVFLQFSQDYPIGFDGLSAGYSVSYVRQHPGGSLADDDIDVASVVGTAFLAYPFLRSEEQSLFGRAEVSVRNDDVDVGGTAVSQARTRWAEFSLQYDRAFDTGFLSTDAGLSLGTASDIDMGDVPGNFRFLTAGLDYIRPLGDVADFRIRAVGQYSSQALPGAVRFSVGGDPYGWAFDNGTISGDSGAATAVELAHDFD
ncbi:unnamed protein product, partial [Ectocarpus sp. 12 AP-2014]